MTKAVFVVVAVLGTACSKRDRVGELIKDLGSDDRLTRSRAAARLSELRPGHLEFDKIPIGAGPLPLAPGEQRIVDALNAALLDEDAEREARSSIAMAIAKLRPPGPQPGLIHCVIEDADRGSICMDAIVKIATPDVLAEMLPLLLVKRERGRGTLAVDEIVQVSLRKTGAGILPGVRSVIDADDDLELSRAVIFDLLYRWPDTVPVPGTHEILVVALRSRFAEVRYQALYALESMDFEAQRDEISELVDDPNLNVRTKAAAMLEGREWYRTENRQIEELP